MAVFFPDLGKNPEELEYIRHVKRRALLQIRGMMGQDTSAEVAKVDDHLFRMHTPKEYAGAGGLEVAMKKQFSETCTLLSQYVSTDPKKMTVLEFYTALETVKKQLKTQNRKR